MGEKESSRRVCYQNGAGVPAVPAMGSSGGVAPFDQEDNASDV